MCLIRVGRVIQKKEKKALCDFEGILKEVSCALFPKVEVGDDVVVSSGFISDVIKNKKELLKQVILTDALSLQILDEITRYAKALEEEFTILNLSNINDYLIEKYSIKDLLPKNLTLVSYSSDSMTSKMQEKLFLEISKEKSILLQGLVPCSSTKASFLQEYLSKEKYLDGILLFEQLLDENKYESENIIVVKKSVTEILEAILTLLKKLKSSCVKLEVKCKKSFK